jgi:hypothetical protein
VLVNEGEPWKAYGRGVYRYVTGGNFSGAGLEDDLLLIYSGSRWFAALFEKGRCRDLDYWMQFSHDYHPFWDEIYDERTHGTSDPTTGSDPIAVDFYKIGRRGQRFGPLGELIPLQDPPGSGYFECAMNATQLLENLVEEIMLSQEERKEYCMNATNATNTTLIEFNK